MGQVRLSELQRWMLLGLAELVEAECHRQGNHELHADDPRGCWGCVPVRSLRDAVKQHWHTDPERSWVRDERSKASAFSRSLRSLLLHGYVYGSALAWVDIDYETGSRRENILEWQGGGPWSRRPDMAGGSYRVQTERISRVGLTSVGWLAARPTQ